MRRSKFNAVRTNGYASKKEADVAANLHLVARAGGITNLREQVTFQLVPKSVLGGIAYRADFVYNDSTGQEVIMDAKGFKTPEYRMKKVLMKFLLNKDIQEV